MLRTVLSEHFPKAETVTRIFFESWQEISSAGVFSIKLKDDVVLLFLFFTSNIFPLFWCFRRQLSASKYHYLLACN